MNPHELTALVARGFRTADLALATTPGCKTVEQMTESERDLLEIGIRAGSSPFEDKCESARAVARASVTYVWADSTTVTCEVESNAEHPDALDQLVTRAFDLYAKVSEFSNEDDDDA